jgi:hypothetical protein
MPLLQNSNTVNSAGFVFFDEQPRRGFPTNNNSTTQTQAQNNISTRRQQAQRLRIIPRESTQGTSASMSFQLARLASRDPSLTPTATTATANPPVHPHFQRKQVYELLCKHCSALLCWRGMKANLLGDTKVELYSTDVPSKNVQPVYQAYVAKSCS